MAPARCVKTARLRSHLVKRPLRIAAIAVGVLVAFAAGWVTGRTGIGAAVDPTSLAQHEREFRARMSHASLVGRFTIAGHEDRPSSPDRYDLTGVDKVGDGLWRFTVRMRHSTVDLTLPVTVPMQWVGGKPMIVMSGYSIPTLGTFSAHVIFDGNQYAGTWANGPVGGLMYGQITPP
jgi:hypothetical protein